MIKWIIILVIFYFVEDLLTYKFIKHVDKKERIKLNKMEEEHVKFMLENENADNI